MQDIEVVSFDCAETLVKVRWFPGDFALDCAKEIGLCLDEQVASETYVRLLSSRWGEYQLINQTRSAEACLAWWRQLGEDWLIKLELDPSISQHLMEASDQMLYDPNRGYFELFEDTMPSLDSLRKHPLRLIVISNWDYSLHRVLRMFDLTDRFEFALASLEEGVEKPDRRLFEIALSKLQVAPEKVLHIGDNPMDDVHGARSAGMKALLLDRAAAPSESTLSSLTQLPWK